MATTMKGTAAVPPKSTRNAIPSATVPSHTRTPVGQMREWLVHGRESRLRIVSAMRKGAAVCRTPSLSVNARVIAARSRQRAELEPRRSRNRRSRSCERSYSYSTASSIRCQTALSRAPAARRRPGARRAPGKRRDLEVGATPDGEAVGPLNAAEERRYSVQYPARACAGDTVRLARWSRRIGRCWVVEGWRPGGFIQQAVVPSLLEAPRMAPESYSPIRGRAPA